MDTNNDISAYTIRGFEVILDRDLARLAGTETRKINQIVKRNPRRFPPEFCFRLTIEEAQKLMSQIVINRAGERVAAPENQSSQNVISVFDGNPIATGHKSRYEYSPNLGGIRKPPMVYTKRGAFMLSAVMRKPLAVEACVEAVERHMPLGREAENNKGAEISTPQAFR